jgi:tetratricopeptide (TPR) repeat protein
MPCWRWLALPRWSRWLGCWTLLGALLGSGISRAEELDESTRGTARQLSAEGGSFYEQGNFQQAYDRFSRAYALEHLAPVGLGAARSLIKLGRWVEASERLLEVQRQPLREGAPPEHAKAREEAGSELEALLPRIPSVRVIIEGAEANDVFVTLNGELLPASLIGAARPVDPGKIAVKGTRGADVVEARVELLERETRDVTLRFRALSAAPVAPAPVPVRLEPARRGPEDPGAGQRTIGYITIGAGGAGIVLGSIFGLLAAGQQSELDAACPERSCPPSHYEALDSYEARKTTASIGLIGGAVLVAGGTALVLSAPTAASARAGIPRRDAASRLGVRFGLGHAALFGELP